jgi:hypothetical protein
MTKMPKMQKIPNLFLLADRDDQLTYFILLTPNSLVHLCASSVQQVIYTLLTPTSKGLTSISKMLKFATTSTFSSINKIGTCFQLCITYMWTLIHCYTTTMVTSSTLTTTKLTFKITDIVLERITSCMASIVHQSLLPFNVSTRDVIHLQQQKKLSQ